MVVARPTSCGDPEVTRLMADEIRLLRQYRRRESRFLGKAPIYSAGATCMPGFPVARRFLAPGRES